MTNPSQYLFCPSENCFNVPELFYLFNPLNNEVKYRCSCDSEHDKKLSLQTFLEKSVLICYECRKKINDSNFLFCKNCKILIHNNCQETHCNKNEHDNFDNVNKVNILNCCREHKFNFMFRCMNCKKSLCNKCDLPSHNEKDHSLIQMREFKINQNALDFVKYNFEKQKYILEIIKNISNNIIKNLENDIIIKQKILNNYINNKANFSSILNIKNLLFKNNEKYENILIKFINEYEKKDEATFAQDKYIDEILLPLYYAMMINQDETLNDSLIGILENKVNILKTFKQENTNNNNNLINIKKQISNKQIYTCFKNDKNNINSNLSNHLNTQKANNAQKTQLNLIQMDFLDSNIQEKEKIEKNEISSFSNTNNLNIKNSNFEKKEKNYSEKKSEIINQNSMNKTLSEIEKSKINLLNKEKNEKVNNFIINKIIALKT